MNKNEYIKKVMKLIVTSRKTKRRIKEDLGARIDEAFDDDPYYDIVINMGTAEEVAHEFMDNLENGTLFSDVVFRQAKPYEYISKMKIGKLPLVHVHTGGYVNTSKAKGIIAIGDIATGVIAIGGVSFGLISAGGVSFGVISIGGVSFGGISIGGVTFGLIALGGAAYGILQALGGVVI